MAIKLDVSFINPFVEGTIETLKTQCSMPVVPNKPFLKGAGVEVQASIAGVIALTSRTFCGSLAIAFPEATFLKIMSNMLGETFPAITSDLEDGAGELLNIIFGHAKRVLNDKGHTIERAIPTIVRGNQLSVRHLSPSPALILPFSSEGGLAFQIEILLSA